MPRTARIAPGGLIYHVLNRGVGRMTLFRSQADYAAFIRCLIETMKTTPVPLLGYCLMPNHWHLVLWPKQDGDLAKFMMRLTITHARRWAEHRHAVGEGHVYQGRYKSFACQTDDHLWTVLRYVERNALRAGLVKQAEQWRWSSLGQENSPPELRVELGEGPQARRRDWAAWINRPQTPAEEAAMLRCIQQDRPYGDERWVRRTMGSLGWREPMKRGRPARGKGRR